LAELGILAELGVMWKSFVFDGWKGKPAWHTFGSWKLYVSM
jgi:hypothetical protein